jgi:proteasome lid subunit RPN8/RPN11
MLRTLTEAEAKGQRVTGVYHSHANAGSYFSEMDQDFATRAGFPFPAAQHVVISVLDGLVRESAVFRRIDGAPGFEGRLLHAIAE